jgi:uncharacterized metal-binding protein YceD (DUF177 family)
MSEQFKIFVDRLKEGHVEKIREVAPPDFLDVHEQELSFPESVSVVGDAYLVDDHVVLHLEIKTVVSLPCSVCNRATLVPIHLKNSYETQPLDEIPTSIFHYTEKLRTALLLQIPAYAECNEGKCPERVSISKYLKSTEQTPSTKASSDPTYFPFAHLDKK